MTKLKTICTLLMLVVLATACRKDDDKSWSPELQEGKLCALALEDIDLSNISEGEDLLIPFKLSPEAYWAEVVFPDGVDENDEWAVIFDFEDEKEDVMWLFVEANETGAPRKASIEVYGWDDVAPAKAKGQAMTRAEAMSKAKIKDVLPFEQNGGELPVNLTKRYGTGYGVDLRGTMDANGLRGAVVNFAKLKKETQQPLLENGASQRKDVTYTGTSQKDISSKLEVTAEAGFSYCAFSGDMKASFGTTKSKSQYHEYGIQTKVNRKGYWAISEEYDVALLREQFLSVPFQRAINDKLFDPQRIIKMFGTHFVARASVGARINYSMILDRSTAKNSMDISASLTVGFKMSVANASTSVSAEQQKAFEENKSSMTTIINCAGGGPNATDLVAQQNLTQWEADLENSENWAVIGFDGPNALIPLWEFVEDAANREALKSAIISYINSGWDNDAAVVQMLEFHNLKWEEPTTMNGKTSIKVIKDESGVPVAELCLEYIPSISRDERLEVVYPLNINKKPVRSRGFFLGNAQQAAGYVNWDDNSGTASYEASDNFSQVKGRIDTLYIRGYTFTNKTIDKASKTRIENVYVNYGQSGSYGFSIEGLVKIGMNTVVTQGFIRNIHSLPLWFWNSGRYWFRANGIAPLDVQAVITYKQQVRYTQPALMLVKPTSYEPLSTGNFNDILRHVGGTEGLPLLFKDGISGFDAERGGITKVYRPDRVPEEKDVEPDFYEWLFSTDEILHYTSSRVDVGIYPGIGEASNAVPAHLVRDRNYQY